MNYSAMSTEFLKQLLKPSNLKHTPDLPIQRPIADVILPQLNTKKGKIWDEYHKGKILHEYKCETKLMEKLKQNQREREKLNRKK